MHRATPKRLTRCGEAAIGGAHAEVWAGAERHPPEDKPNRHAEGRRRAALKPSLTSKKADAPMRGRTRGD